jgi:hypothetical protein
MSHFSRIKTKFKDRSILIGCLKELGYKISDSKELRGDQGIEKVEFIVEVGSGYNIGFVKDTDGAYKIVADWWRVKAKKSDFTKQLEEKFEAAEQKLRQAYALKITLDQFKKQGFKIINQEHAEDGTIKLLARRWI